MVRTPLQFVFRYRPTTDDRRWNAVGRMIIQRRLAMLMTFMSGDGHWAAFVRKVRVQAVPKPLRWIAFRTSS